MLSHVRPAIYRCPFLVKKPFAKSSATYHSPLNLPQSETPFFKAWPGIGADPRRPCCLPTLERARYFLDRDTLIEFEEVIAGAERYLSHQVSIEPEVKEAALAIVKYHKAFWSSIKTETEIKYPPILSGVNRFKFELTDLNIEELSLMPLAQEVAIQGLIYGNLIPIHKDRKLGNIFSVSEAFDLAHETGHELIRRSYCGSILDDLSHNTHVTLSRITTKNLSPDQIVNEWKRFNDLNKRISHLTEKFEPIEEIFANYVGWRYSPICVKNEVKKLIENDLREKNWDDGYNAFSEVCDYAEYAWLTVALLITDVVSWMLYQLDRNGIDIDSVNLLCNFIEIFKIIRSYKERIEDDYYDLDLPELLKQAENKAAEQINRILEQAGISKELYWYHSASYHKEKIPYYVRLAETILNNDFSHEHDKGKHGVGCAPKITLIGQKADNYIEPVSLIYCDYYNENYVSDKLFFDSLRQQLGQHCGIVCPSGYMNKCCSRREDLKKLFERLPEEDKKHFRAPDCELDRTFRQSGFPPL